MHTQTYNSGITVIIPIYNAENSLKKCIDSIINQEYTEWKLILVDDGSTDSSGMLCNEYSEIYDNISVIHKENGGVSSARNAGMRQVNTKYFVFVDSDDYVDKDYLSVLFEAKLKFSDSTIWSCVRTVNNLKGDNPVSFVTGSELYSFYTREQIITILQYYIGQGPCGKLFETEYVVENKLSMNESISYGEDLTFNLEYLDVLNSPRITIVNIPTYNYVQNDGSLSHNYDSNLKEKYDYVNNIVFDYMKKWNLSDSQYKIYYNLVFNKYLSLFNYTMSASDKEFTFSKKIKANNQVLRSDSYKHCYNEVKKSLGLIRRIVYYPNSYMVIYLFDKSLRIVKILK